MARTRRRGGEVRSARKLRKVNRESQPWYQENPGRNRMVFVVPLVAALLTVGGLAYAWHASTTDSSRDDQARSESPIEMDEPSITATDRPDGLEEPDEIDEAALAAAVRADRREFLAVADRLEHGDNLYLGTAILERLKRSMTAPGARLEEKAFAQLTLANELLRLGNVDGAKREIDDVFQTMQRPLPAMLVVRATAYLREAEVENCIKQHNRDCCIFPLAQGGVHARQQAAKQAQQDLLTILQSLPEELSMQWLVNVTAMAIGQYPDGVPDPYRIPPEALESEVDLGMFQDAAPALGVDPLSLCGGAIAEDFNGDGLIDLATSSFDPREPLRYYRNLGADGFREETESAGLSGQLGGLNCISGDYDNDGDMDLLVLRGAWLADDGRIRNSLLRNNGPDDAGRITFTDVTRETGVASPPSPSQSAAWGDFDNDGDLDLFVANESGVELTSDVNVAGQVSQRSGGSYPCQLFLNHGAERSPMFTDVAVEAGVTNDRFAKGVAVGDYDNDGDLDLYVSNVGRNRLYRNDGVVDGRPHFTDVAESLGVAAPTDYSFATWFFDYDNDGWLDLFVAAYDADTADLMAEARGLPHDGVAPCLYRNLGADDQGRVRFRNVADQVGLDRPFLPMGANFGDVDNDGFLDVYLATGDPSYLTLMPNAMLRNDRGRQFQDATTAAGLGHLQKGHGVAIADVDNDGDQDIYNQLGGFYPGDKFQNALFMNPGHEGRYLKIKLVGRQSSRTAYGARIRVEVLGADGDLRSIHRAVGSVSSFGGSPAQQAIGLGDATEIRRVTITWPRDGFEQTVTDVPLDSTILVTEREEGFRQIDREPVRFSQLAK